MIDLIGYGAFFLSTALIFSLVTLGLNLQWGLTGLFNVGLAGFVAIGAYTSALLTTPDDPARLGGFGLPILAGWAGAMVVGGVAAALTGIATLRLRSDYLAITTFGVAVVVQLVALNAQKLTGGPFGIGFIPRPFGSLAETPLLFNLSNLAVVSAVTLIAYLALEHLSRSPWGRVLKALREDERAAISLGKSARFYRVQAFAVGGAIMALAGALQAHFIGFIAPDNYLSILTFQVWVMLIVGGSGSNAGAVAGSVLVWAIWAGSGALTSVLFAPEQQARAASLQIVAIGVMLCVILLVRPNGVFGERPRRARFGKRTKATASESGS
ncbi:MULTISPECIES: branched-chain amino acid ABC transporter permease [unclassified Mesorhizobium]|uniref:branched-chain amino acid ABC transporter permease n=1 Tax=unclassified Mesorhizobium TaxID=325217 RepID=UPI001CCD3902|nr:MULTISPECIES: branched-chain amino acid ABC transporter permease [unclassified Mesorhizobium]MBZ9734537.1 branched-chain amino acid ABC transporter permease [Mesorhizobium sp. CA9]MBZ9768885.1 branched-chain amino acid ABC transporter permease [Mesorhizobium sp. CA6]MBZ9812138.1 branched-chain amino acid ABC transporter permease [Mesorhizobium sp. CA7]MBZ9826927.1 branched-chain amino acid ABC transporter permease [Mesorhizobium sp. CA18]MBZ9832451.1 branched-chain amino acid ABC transporte